MAWAALVVVRRGAWAGAGRGALGRGAVVAPGRQPRDPPPNESTSTNQHQRTNIQELASANCEPTPQKYSAVAVYSAVALEAVWTRHVVLCRVLCHVLCRVLCSPLLHLLLWLHLRCISTPCPSSRFHVAPLQAIERATGKQFEGRQQQEGGEEEEDEEEDGPSSGEGADEGEQQDKGAEGGAAGGDEDGEVEPAAEDQAAMTGEGWAGVGQPVHVHCTAFGHADCGWAPCRWAGAHRGLGTSAGSG